MVCLAVVALAAAEKAGPGQSQTSHPPLSSGDASPEEQLAVGRLREGAELVDQLGHFEIANQRLVFVADRGKLRLVGLENLNLERVARTVAGYPGQLSWKICGTVTECRGNNYLLVRRAVVVSSQSTK